VWICYKKCKATTLTTVLTTSSVSVNPTQTETIDSTLTNLPIITNRQLPSVNCGSSPQQLQQYAGDQQTYVLSRLRHTPIYSYSPYASTPVQGPYISQAVMTDNYGHKTNHKQSVFLPSWRNTGDGLNSTLGTCTSL